MDNYSSNGEGLDLIDARLAGYRPATDLAASCGVCVHYEASCGGCDVVAGPIRPDYACDAFAAADLLLELASEMEDDSEASDLAETPVLMSGDYQVAKSDDAQQTVFGWANIAISKSGEQTLDAHLDLIDSADLEAAAYDFMLNARVSGEDHLGDVDATCVESIVFTKEKANAMGIPEGILPEAGWWVGFHIPDRASYDRARDGKSMFSIEGTAVREPVLKSAIAPHKTATSDAAWDGPVNEANVLLGQTASYYGKIYAWSDPTADPTVKTPYRFVHHEVSADGTPGAANVKALQTAIGVLNGGRGVDVSAQPWAKDRAAIHRHLAAHLADAGLTAPPLK